MARAYYNRGVLLVKQLVLDDAAIKDFEEASKLQPGKCFVYYRLGQCYRQKGEAILASGILREGEKAVKEQENFGTRLRIFSSTQGGAGPRSDAELSPLEKAKKDLEKKLDATAEK